LQRPGVRVQVERDLALLSMLARRFERLQPGSVAFRPSEAVAELAEYTRRELDFQREARTTGRLRQLLAADGRIVIPAVISDRSSARVLTTELLDGLRPEPAAGLRRAGIDPEAGLRAGAAAMLRQVLVTPSGGGAQVTCGAGVRASTPSPFAPGWRVAQPCPARCGFSLRRG